MREQVQSVAVVHLRGIFSFAFLVTVGTYLLTHAHGNGNKKYCQSLVHREYIMGTAGHKHNHSLYSRYISGTSRCIAGARACNGTAYNYA